MDINCCSCSLYKNIRLPSRLSVSRKRYKVIKVYTHTNIGRNTAEAESSITSIGSGALHTVIGPLLCRTLVGLWSPGNTPPKCVSVGVGELLVSLYHRKCRRDKDALDRYVRSEKGGTEVPETLVFLGIVCRVLVKIRIRHATLAPASSS